MRKFWSSIVLALWVLLLSLTLAQSAAARGLASIFTPSLFDEMLKHHNDTECASHGFYTYNAFVTAAKSFPAFGNTGSLRTRKREIAAFLGQTSEQTSAQALTAPDGQFAWGYCTIKEDGATGNFCTSTRWPCPAGKRYYGRGPIMLTGNRDYGRAGRAIEVNLVHNPDLVATNAVISFKTAIWFWMMPDRYIPSSHDVITGKWTPSAADKAAGRVPGYGVITNIIDGRDECGIGAIDRVANRVGFYKRYCDILKVSTGDNLYCYDQKPFP